MLPTGWIVSHFLFIVNDSKRSASTSWGQFFFFFDIGRIVCIAKASSIHRGPCKKSAQSAIIAQHACRCLSEVRGDLVVEWEELQNKWFADFRFIC